MTPKTFLSPLYPHLPFDPNYRYTTSWLLSPFLLALSRSLFALYAFVTLLTIFIYNGTHDDAVASRRSFSYFTHLTYWGLAFYFLFSAIHTWSYVRSAECMYTLQRWPRALQGLHGVLYATVVTFPPVVTIVYWGILYGGTWFPVRFDAWSNLSQHAFNSLFCFFEVIVPRTTPPPPVFLVCIVLLLALYLSLAYITHATQGFYVYSFLDVSRGSGKTAGYIVGILLVACVIFGIMSGIIWLRMKLTERKEREGEYPMVHSSAGREDVEMMSSR